MAEFINFNKDLLCTGQYSNSRTAIIQMDSDGMQEAVLTVNLPDKPLGDGFVHIKNYSENEGILDDLIESGIVSEPIRWEQSGFVSIPICQLLTKLEPLKRKL